MFFLWETSFYKLVYIKLSFLIITGFKQSLRFNFPGFEPKKYALFRDFYLKKVMFFPESSWKWVLFPGLNFATHLLNLSSWETKIFAYCIKSHSKNWKTQSKNSLQTILTNYYRRPQSKQYLISVIRAFQTFLKNYYHSK